MRKTAGSRPCFSWVWGGMLIALAVGCQQAGEPDAVPDSGVAPVEAVSATESGELQPEDLAAADASLAAEVGESPEPPVEPPVEPPDRPETVAGEEDGFPLYPLSVAVSPSGELFVADHHLPGIWRTDGDRWQLFFQAEKTFRTPLNAIRCVAFDRQGNLLAGDSATGDVYRFNEDGQPESLTARDRPLGEITIPMAIAVAAGGDLLVADLGDHRLLRIPAGGGSVEVVAELPVPRGLDIDQDQRLWVISGGRLLRLSPDGESETIVDQGVFEFPHAVVIWDEVAYVSDGYARTIWRIEPGQAPEAWVQGAPLENPVGLALGEERLLVADPRARAIFAMDAEGQISAIRWQK